MENTTPINSTGDTDKILKAIQIMSMPVQYSDIEWKIQTLNKDTGYGIIVPYVKKSSCVARLNKAFTKFGWSNSMVRCDGGFICSISVTIGSNTITKTDAGSDSDRESFKGGASDSFKRAAKMWGFGKELDDFPVLRFKAETDSKTGRFSQYISYDLYDELEKVHRSFSNGDDIASVYKLNF